MPESYEDCGPLERVSRDLLSAREFLEESLTAPTDQLESVGSVEEAEKVFEEFPQDLRPFTRDAFLAIVSAQGNLNDV